MKQNVLLSIVGRQTYPGQEPDSIELVTAGNMEQIPGGRELSYQQSDLTGLDGVLTTFRVEQGKITLTREGKLRSQMVFQEGVSHDSLYDMPFGALMLTVKATSVFYDLVEDGGQIVLSYQIVIENTEAGVIDYHLDIRAKE